MKNQEEQENTLDLYNDLTRSLYKKSLVIDSDLIAQHTHRSYLQQCNFLVDVASTRQNALKHVCNKQYDLIITNLQLSSNIDESIVTQLRQLPSLNSNTSLIVVTGAGNSLKPRCMQAGAKAFVVKPLSMETLFFILKEIFDYPKVQAF